MALARKLLDVPRRSFNRYFDVNKVKLNVENTLNFQTDCVLVNDFVDIFNEYGFVILECAETNQNNQNRQEFVENNELNLQYLFGSISEYEAADTRGILSLDSLSPHSEFVASAEIIHAPHTDGSFSVRPEKIVSLGCVVECESGGGKSILVSGQSIIEYIHELCKSDDIYSVGYKRLFDEDCMTTGRRLLNSKQWFEATKPIFRKNAGNGMIEMCYCDRKHMLRMNEDDALIKLWDKIRSFVENDSNQLHFQLKANQIAVLDNYGLLHGRTVFEEGELRIMKRTNFHNDAKGLLFDCLKHGMETV
eukprot:255609_1